MGRTRMASGKHTSIRVALAVPPKLHEQLAAWAESEGRPMASLCMYLIEQSLRQAQKDGIAPSLNTQSSITQTNSRREGKSFTNTINDRIANHGISEGTLVSEEEMNEENEINTAVGREAVRVGKYTKSKDEMTKKELLMAAISEALFE